MIRFLDKYQKELLYFLVVSCGVFLTLEILRDVHREGDFGGYIEAGKLAWSRAYIYSAHRNTWPPFMSIAAIPLHWLNSLSFIGLRLIWLVGLVLTYWYIFKWTIAYFLKQSLVFRLKASSDSEVPLINPLFLVPFLLTFRVLIEEVSNLQVNVTILALCILSLIFTLRSKSIIAGLLLALVISTKVYPIILIPFLIYKKQFRTTLYASLGLGATYLVTLLYFGEGSSALYLQWYTKQVSEGLQCIHFNQSLWGFICGLFSENARFESFQYNIASLTIAQTKIISMGTILFIGILVAYRFFKKRTNQNALALQWLIVLSYIPVFSPLAWKCYFVFLTPIVILLYHKLSESKTLWMLFIPLLLITFSSELFIGNTFSDISESLGIITLSSLYLSLLATYKLTEEFDSRYN